MTYTFDQVPGPAIDSLIDTIREHGVDFEFHRSRYGVETFRAFGTFKSVAGAGSFEYFRKTLTVTITRDNGHFSRLMIKGGLRQLVGEAVEQLALPQSP